MSRSKYLNRREFLATAVAVTAPLILPSGVLAQNGKPGANDRLVLGHIGTGGMGTGHLKYVAGRDDVVSAAVCDVDQNHLKRAHDITGGKAETFTDYRRLLERKDLDGVIIASPDHWHGIMMVQACQAGKDVYVEKPSSKTIEEGRAMINAAERSGRVVQVGSQGRSTPAAVAAWNYIRNGNIGDVSKVTCWHYENPVGGDPAKNGPAPPELDWDKWLGPASWVKYNPDRVHFNFRWMLDFGGGQIRDRGAHVLSVASWILDLDNKYPVRVSATGTPPAEGLWDCAPDFAATWEFKDPDLTISWEQPGENPVDDKFGAVYHGANDKLIVYGGDGGCRTEKKAATYEVPSDGEHAFESPGHHQNWFDCIKTREKTHMNIEAGHAVATMCILANLSYRLQRPIEWDGANELIVGDEAANRLLGSPGRGEWHL